MHVHQVHFIADDETAREDELRFDASEAVVAAWRLNGQVCGREWAFAPEAGGFSTVVMSPEPNSLEEQFDGAYVKKALGRARDAGVRVACHSLGEEPGSATVCACEQPSAFVLFTNFVALESPVRCMDCFGPVPLYRFKAMDSGEFHELIAWQSDYQACDSLQMNCTVLERAATRQLASVESQLTRVGRAHGQALAASSGSPFYYYLYRDRGRSLTAEMARCCPGCGAAWHLAQPLHGRFDFCCDHCRLLSNLAWAFRATAPAP